METTKVDLLTELDNEVKNWVAKTFNHVQVSVLQELSEARGVSLIEHIRQPDDEQVVEDWLDEVGYRDIIKAFIDSHGYKPTLIHECYDFDGNIKDSFEGTFPVDWDEFVEFCTEEFSEDLDEHRQENDMYPMWNTLFEFKDNVWCQEKDLQKAMKIGLGIIEGFEPYEPMLFMNSAGHSFYSSYWIPLYLAVNDTAREKYKGLDYHSL